jgi:hypothetical protein
MIIKYIARKEKKNANTLYFVYNKNKNVLKHFMNVFKNTTVLNVFKPNDNKPSVVIKAVVNLFDRTFW